MELKIELDAERAKKLTYLQQHSNQDLVRLVYEAIDQSYESVRHPTQNAYQVFEEYGLIGCMSEQDELPTTDQPSIREQLQRKRREGRL